MQTIYRPSEARITLSEAQRLILTASAQETWMDVIQPVGEDGEDLVEAGIEVVEVVRSVYFATLNRGLVEVLAELGISPAFKYFLPQKDFTEASELDAYVITHDEFVALAKYCDVSVLIGEEPPADPPKEEAGSSVITPPVRWTEKVIEEARERSQQTSSKAAAEHYGVSRQRLEAILNKGAKKQAKSKASNVFSGLGKKGR